MTSGTVGDGRAAAPFEEVVSGPWRMAGSWLVGATTYAIDRAVPQVELIYQPGGDFDGALRLALAADPVTAPPVRWSSRLARVKARLRPATSVDLGGAPFLDMRADSYFNWSHHVNKYLPTALYVRERIGVAPTIALPTRLPRTAGELYERFGFEVLRADGAITGRRIEWSMTDSTAFVDKLLARFMAAHDGDARFFPHLPHLPAKPFVARRGSRRLANEAEIEALLARSGYVKVYAEDLSVDEQIALWRQATHAVAIHGAGVAPLQFRSRAAPPIDFVELCPIGHMTRMFRIICEQVGGRYCGVRGRIEPAHVAHLYGTGVFTRHSNDAFEIDPHSLRVALDIVARGGIREDYPDRWPLEP